MNKKLFFTGILSVLLIFGFVFVGCDNGTETKVVEVTVPGPVVTVPGPTVTVETENYGDLVRKLLEAGDKNIEDPTTTQQVVINRPITVQGNNTITVPNGVELVIKYGARLTIEANAILFIREKGKVIVNGDLYFEDNAQGDDIRQTKFEGQIIIDGGTMYDKSASGLLLQYVTKVKDGGRLAFGGGVAGVGGAPTRERYFLGQADFTGEIKLVFGGAWEKNKPVIITGTESLLSETNATAVANAPTKPALIGFEMLTDVTINSGKLVVASALDSALAAAATNPKTLFFKVPSQKKLTIASGAEFSMETFSAADGTASTAATSYLDVEPLATVEVSGTLVLPFSATVSKNAGTITVKDNGVLLDDGTSFLSAITPIGTITFDKAAWGRIANNTRAVTNVWIGNTPSSTGIRTDGKVKLAYSGDGNGVYSLKITESGSAEYVAAFVTAATGFKELAIDKAKVTFTNGTSSAGTANLVADTKLTLTNGATADFTKPFTAAPAGDIKVTDSNLTFSGDTSTKWFAATAGSIELIGSSATLPAIPPASTTTTTAQKRSKITLNITSANPWTGYVDAKAILPIGVKSITNSDVVYTGTASAAPAQIDLTVDSTPTFPALDRAALNGGNTFTFSDDMDLKITQAEAISNTGLVFNGAAKLTGVFDFTIAGGSKVWVKGDADWSAAGNVNVSGSTLILNSGKVPGTAKKLTLTGSTATINGAITLGAGATTIDVDTNSSLVGGGAAARIVGDAAAGPLITGVVGGNSIPGISDLTGTLPAPVTDSSATPPVRTFTFAAATAANGAINWNTSTSKWAW